MGLEDSYGSWIPENSDEGKYDNLELQKLNKDHKQEPGYAPQAHK